MYESGWVTNAYNILNNINYVQLYLLIILFAIIKAPKSVSRLHFKLILS